MAAGCQVAFPATALTGGVATVSHPASRPGRPLLSKLAVIVWAKQTAGSQAAPPRTGGSSSEG